MITAALVVGHVMAHDLITADYAEKYLALATQYAHTLKSSEPDTKRAEAAYQLGRMLDQIREYLNRDIAAHGAVQGLTSNKLVSELKVRGVPLAQDADGRYVANLRYYRDALKLAPQGEHHSDALFRLAHGYFYDSFGDDPLKPRAQSAEQLKQQIEVCERFTQRFPHHSDIEEGRFILLIHYVQAARGNREYVAKAHAAIADFEKRYPDSMRTSALPLMREALPGR